jgi:uncharacterized protein YfaP (DUF2135 family)
MSLATRCLPAPLHAIALALCIGTPAPWSMGTARAQVTIDTPRAGWRHSAGERASFVQPVHYPASSVNTEGADTAVLITGRIANARKPAATLVVNGAAMPLVLDGSGGFARPYLFAKGSNSIEVRDGAQRARRQFYDAYAERSPAKLRVVLSWDTDATDVDLHVIGPGGEHAWYGDRVTRSGGALDVDVTTGFGPEIFAHPNPQPGLWQVYVNYYGGGIDGDGFAEGTPVAHITTAQVAIISGEGPLNERQQVFRVPLRRPGELTLIRSFVYP